MKEGLKPQTRAAQALHAVDSLTGAVVPPLQPATTFARNSAHDLVAGFLYSRESSPTIAHAEAVIGDLDGGQAVLFASGLAAFAALIETVPAGGHVVAPKVMYHGAQDWLRRLDRQGRIALTLCEAHRPDALAAAARRGTALICIETPANPSWEVTDIAAAAEIAHGFGARLAVDSTVAPPPTTRPLALGADIVFHSATKYLNGHSDLTAGVLVVSAAAEAWLAELRRIRTLSGSVLGAFEAWLLLRGLRTLFVRYQRQSDSALAIARHFAGDRRIVRVLYPGLPDHPGHDIARRQMTGGFGGMLSILIDGDRAAARRVATATEVFLPATSLGGVESLIEHRHSVQSPETPVDERLLRLSVGLEDPGDLMADLDRALARALTG